MQGRPRFLALSSSRIPVELCQSHDVAPSPSPSLAHRHKRSEGWCIVQLHHSVVDERLTRQVQPLSYLCLPVRVSPHFSSWWRCCSLFMEGHDNWKFNSTAALCGPATSTPMSQPRRYLSTETMTRSRAPSSSTLNFPRLPDDS